LGFAPDCKIRGFDFLVFFVESGRFFDRSDLAGIPDILIVFSFVVYTMIE
jgi:hypothetical protein